MKKLKLSIVIVYFIAGCSLSTSFDREFRDFYLKPGEERAEEFAAYPIEKQYEIYMWGVRNFHPSPLHLAEVMGKGGMPSAIYVANRMAGTSDPVELSSALVVFEWMQLHGIPVCDNKEIVEAMARGLVKSKGTIHEKSYRNILFRTCPIQGIGKI